MSMSTHVIGFITPSETYKLKVAAWRACAAAGVDIPTELNEFFNYETPQDAGMQVKIDLAVYPYSANCKSGFDVDINKLPPGVSVVRFYNSY
jgi:hypothetical protein